MVAEALAKDMCSGATGGVLNAKSICEGSFFAKSRMPLQKWLLMLYLWVRE